MFHKFTAIGTDIDICSECHRTEAEHTAINIKCGKCGELKPCDYFKKIKAVLCSHCAALAAGFDGLKETPVLTNYVSPADRLKEDLSQITAPGSLFNSKMIALIELKKSIWADETIPQDEKHFYYQKRITEIYEHLSKVVFDKEKEITKIQTELLDPKAELLAIGKEFRDYGSELRAEIREKIRQSDLAYKPEPVKKPVKTDSVKKSSAKKTPMDRLIEALALSQGIDKDKARILLESGKISL